MNGGVNTSGRASGERAPWGAMNTSHQASPAPPAAPLALTLSPALLELLVEQVAERVAARESGPREAWVGVDRAAAHLGCGRQRVYDLVCRRRSTGIPHRKEGARLLFRLSELDSWIESGSAA